jgi:hypothetical protein
MEPLPGQIMVDLEPDADPIAGRVRAHDQDPRAFTGWTGLFAALLAATGQDGHGDPRGVVRDSGTG